MAVIQGWQEQDWGMRDPNANLLFLTEDGQHVSSPNAPLFLTEGGFDARPAVPPPPPPPPVASAPPPAPAPAAALASMPLAATASSTPSATPHTRTPEELGQILAAWTAYAGPDSYRLFQQMGEYGWDAADLAQATGMSLQGAGDYLTSIGAPAGFGGDVTLGREAIHVPFQLAVDQARAQPQAGAPGWTATQHRDEHGFISTTTTFDVQAFTAWYLTQPQGQALARIHGAVSSDGAGGVRFASGATCANAGVDEAGVPLTTATAITWNKDERIDQYASYPRASDEERLATFAAVNTPINAELLKVFGGSEGLPANPQGEIMRARYGTDLGTLLYRLDRATQTAKDHYTNELNQAMAGASELGWTTSQELPVAQYNESGSTFGVNNTTKEYDESAGIVRVRTFSEMGFHQALTSRTDDKSQLMAVMYGQASVNDLGRLVVQGEGGTLTYSFSRDEDGALTAAQAINSLPPGLVKVDLANPPKLRDATQVGFISGIGFVTDASNIIPPKKKKSWLKAALTIAAVVAISCMTVGAGAAVVGTSLGTGMGSTVVAGAITGAVTSAATSLAAGLIMNGQIDLKSVLKNGLTGAITGGVMSGLQGSKTFQDLAKIQGAQTAARMVAQGTLQMATGGDFKGGALSGLAQGVGDYAKGFAASLQYGEGVSKAIGNVSKALVTGAAQGESEGWNSLANDWASDLISPHIRSQAARQDALRQSERAQDPAASNPLIGSNARWDDGIQLASPELIAWANDPLAQASPPQLYGDDMQWMQGNQQALEEVKAEQALWQRAQDAERSTAQGTFRQSELAQQASEPRTVSAGNYGGSLERVARSQLGPHATQREINNYVGQLFEINEIRNARAIQPGEVLTLPNDNTAAATSGLARYGSDIAVGEQIKALAAIAAQARAAQAQSLAELGSHSQGWSDGDLPINPTDWWVGNATPAAADLTAAATDPLPTVKPRTTLLEDLKIGFLNAANIVDNTASLIAGSAVSLGSTDYGDGIFRRMDQRSAERTNLMGLHDKEQGWVGQTISLVPVLLTTPFAAGNTGVLLVKNGESAQTAVIGSYVTTAGLVAATGLGPAGLGLRPIANLEIAATISGMRKVWTDLLVDASNAALGTALTVTRDAATRTAITSWTETPASNALFQPNLDSSMQMAVMGALGTKGGPVVKQASAWIPLALGGGAAEIQPWLSGVIDGLTQRQLESNAAIDKVGARISGAVKDADQYIDTSRKAMVASAQEHAGAPGKAVAQLLDSEIQILQGAALAGYGMVSGLGSLGLGVSKVVNPVEWLANPDGNVQRIVDAATTASTVAQLALPAAWLINPQGNLEASKTLVNGLTSGYQNDFDEGNYWKGLGRLVVDVGSLGVGVGQVNAAVRAGRAGEVAEAAAAAGRVADDLDALRRAEGAVLAEHSLQPGPAVVGTGATDVAPVTSGGTANAATGVALRDDLARVAKPDSKVGQRADGGTTYSYGSVRQGQGLDAYVDASGVLRLEVKSGARRQQYGSGTEMFDDMMSTMNKNGQVNEILGQWSNTPGLTSNFDAMLSNLKAGMSPDAAALDTWTGRQAARYGFTNVEVSGNATSGYIASFTKGPQ